ncbi:hypothetical protein ACFYOA_18965 [Streptomyces iakyrus]|uniref:hypothetical protein n=1 Tax=Streptomyces iakyrus TaxID=68219 RepID=UPI0036B29A3A
MIRRARRQGLVAGTAGSVVMTLGEKIEAGRDRPPRLRCPARVLRRLTGLPEHPRTQPLPLNLDMHFGQAALFGVLRSVMAQSGLRGPVASAQFTVVRLTNDQALENADPDRQRTSTPATAPTPAAQARTAQAAAA